MSLQTTRETNLAQLELRAKNADCHFKLETQRLENERLKSTYHFRKKSDLVEKVLDKWDDPVDFCLLTGHVFLTLKDELVDEEKALLQNILQHMMERKSSSDVKNGSTISIDTGCESD